MSRSSTSTSKKTLRRTVATVAGTAKAIVKATVPKTLTVPMAASNLQQHRPQLPQGLRERQVLLTTALNMPNTTEVKIPMPRMVATRIMLPTISITSSKLHNSSLPRELLHQLRREMILPLPHPLVVLHQRQMVAIIMWVGLC